MKMKKNEGKTDRIIRIGTGFLALSAGIFYFSGPVRIAAITVGLIGLITGAVGYCGLYSIFGISTCPINKNKQL